MVTSISNWLGPRWNTAKPTRGVVDPGLIGILVTALLARWAVSHLATGDLLSRTWEYELIAGNLLNGNGFAGAGIFLDNTTYRALVLPVYPLICAAVYWFVGHPSLAAMQLVQAVSVLPAGWCAYALGSELAGRRAGLLAALGVTLHPALLLFSLRRHALWFDAVVFLIVLWATFRARLSVRLSLSIALGALFGFGLLSRTTMAGSMLIACAWLVWQWRAPLRVSLPHVAVILGIGLLLPAPWMVRNAVVLHRPMGFISTTSYNLWVGNNPATTGGAMAADGTGMYTTAPALTAATHGLSELEQQDIFGDAAVAYIAENPGRTVLNFAKKLRIFLFWSEQTGAWYPGWFRNAYLAFYLLLLGCATAGAYRLIQAGNLAAVVLCVGFVLSVGLVQSIFFVEGRHRWEVESALIILAACGVARRGIEDRGTGEA